MGYIQPEESSEGHIPVEESSQHACQRASYTIVSSVLHPNSYIDLHIRLLLVVGVPVRMLDRGGGGRFNGEGGQHQSGSGELHLGS